MSGNIFYIHLNDKLLNLAGKVREDDNNDNPVVKERINMHNDFIENAFRIFLLPNQTKIIFVYLFLALIHRFYMDIFYIQNLRIIMNSKLIKNVENDSISIFIMPSKTFGSAVIVLECRRGYLTHQKRQR